MKKMLMKDHRYQIPATPMFDNGQFSPVKGYATVVNQDGTWLQKQPGNPDEVFVNAECFVVEAEQWGYADNIHGLSVITTRIRQVPDIQDNTTWDDLRKGKIVSEAWYDNNGDHPHEEKFEAAIMAAREAVT